MFSLKNRGLVICVIFLVSIIIVRIANGHGILGSAVEIGEDEHYEVSKAALWAKGYHLYEQVWNDQPPLYTIALGVLFKIFGPTIGIARALALIFGLTLITSCFLFAKVRLGWVAAWLSTVCLLISPGVLKYCLSSMLEVPAIATAILAWWPLNQYFKTQHIKWIMVSAFLFAIALQIKLTAIIVGPALFIEIIFANKISGLRLKSGVILRNILLWIFGLNLTFWLIFIFAGDGIHESFLSHFSAATREKAISIGWPANLFFENRDVLCCAAAGWLMLIYYRDWWRLAFPLTILFTAATVHLVQRPWWPYYYVHFAVPFALLSGYGFSKLLAIGRSSLRFRAVFIAVEAVLLFQIIMISGRQLLGTISQIKAQPIIWDSKLIQEMKHFENQTHWAYSTAPIYIFHAGFLEIPELAVLPQKRFWSGQMTDKLECGYIDKYHPQQIIVDENVTQNLNKLINRYYTLVYCDATNRLFVANSIFIND